MTNSRARRGHRAPELLSAPPAVTASVRKFRINTPTTGIIMPLKLKALPARTLAGIEVSVGSSPS